MAGRVSAQATLTLEEGEMQISASPPSSNSVPIKFTQPLPISDTKVHEEGDPSPSLNTSFANSSSPKTANFLPQKQQISLRPGTDLPPLEQRKPSLNLGNPPKQRSFLQVVQTDSEWSQELSDLDFPFKQITLYQGKPSIDFSTQEQSVLLAGLKFVLVGKFTHGRPPMSAIQTFFAGLKLKGKFKLSLLDKKHIFIECFCKADFYFIWLKLSWSILGYTMRIFKWDSDFVTTKESSVAPVWIRLTNLPLYFFEVKTLLSIANVIGCPIKIDPMNVNRTDLGTARFCVELDVARPLIDGFWINLVDDSAKKLGGFWVNVSYDVVPAYCLDCFHIGHGRDQSKRLMEDKKLADTLTETETVGQKISAPLDATTVVVRDANSVVEQPELAVDATDSLAVVEVVKSPVSTPAEIQQGEFVVDATDTVAVVEVVQGTIFAPAEVQQESVSATLLNTEVVLEFTSDAVIQGAGQGPEKMQVSPASLAPTQPVVKQIWQKVNSKNPVKMQTETASVKKNAKNTPIKGNIVSTANRFTVFSESVPSLNVSHEVADCGAFSAVDTQQRSSSVLQQLEQAQTLENNMNVGVEQVADSPPVQEQVTVSETVAEEMRTWLQNTETWLQIPSVKQIVADIPPPTVSKEAIPQMAAPSSGPDTEIQQIGVHNRVSAAAKDTHADLEDTSPSNVAKAITTKTATPFYAADMKQVAQTRTAEISDVQQGVSTVRQNSVTTRAQARKLATEQHKQQQFEKTPDDSVKKIWDQIGLNLKLYDPSTLKPQRTKDGCPVVFKREDVKKWMARQKEREQEQMRGQGLPFDDKG